MKLNTKMSLEINNINAICRSGSSSCNAGGSSVNVWHGIILNNFMWACMHLICMVRVELGF